MYDTENKNVKTERSNFSFVSYKFTWHTLDQATDISDMHDVAYVGLSRG